MGGMTLNTTEHYQLNQWEGSDRIMREDFNADNRKTEEALTELAETVAQKLGQAEVDATLQWVKIGEGKLSGDSRTLSVTVPNAEQYRLFLLLVDATSNFTVYLQWHNTDCGMLFRADGNGTIQRGGGIFLAVPLPGFGLFKWYAGDCQGPGGGLPFTDYELVEGAATSGDITAQLYTESGKVLHAGTSLTVYGLRA